MSEAELDARIEIAREFLHDFISRPTHLKMFGAQDSDEWLRLSGFFAEGAIIPDPKHNQWRVALGMEPIPDIACRRWLCNGGKL